MLTLPFKAGQRHDFTLPDCELEWPRIFGDPEFAHLQHRGAKTLAPGREQLIQFPPNHHLYQASRRHPCKRLGSHTLPVLEHSHGVADIENLFHAVRNIDDCLACFTQSPYLLIQYFDIRGV